MDGTTRRRRTDSPPVRRMELNRRARIKELRDSLVPSHVWTLLELNMSLLSSYNLHYKTSAL
jgi:hypothetical protein